MANVSYPPGSFYFQLQFDGALTSPDNAFQEVAGLSDEWEVAEGREGEQDQYKHRLPTVARHPNLVLRRGYVGSNSDLASWCEATMAADFSTPLKLRNVLLSLVDAAGTPLASWSFREAWPVKWSISDFTSQENALAIETLEFAYSHFRRL